MPEPVTRDSASHLIVPQSNCIVSTSGGDTKRSCPIRVPATTRTSSSRSFGGHTVALVACDDAVVPRRIGGPVALTIAPDRRALVTGAASGFGLGVVDRLLEAGARV